MPKVVSKSAETNAVSDYFVSALAGPRVAGRRVAKGEKLQLSEHEARGELLSGALVRDKALVDDPWGEKAAAKALKDAADKVAADKAAADAKAAEEKAAHDAQAAADAEAARKAEEAAAAQAAAEKPAADAAAGHHDDATHDEAPAA